MLVENKYVYRCNAISEVDGFLSVREVLKLEMFGDEYSEGIRNFEAVIEELKRIYPKLQIPEYKDKIEVLSTDEEERYSFVDNILSSLVKDCGVNQDFFNYAIWACDTPEDVADSYNIEDCDISKYLLKEAILLQDLGPEGCLYGVSVYPEEIFEESKFMAYTNVFKKIYEDTNSVEQQAADIEPPINDEPVKNYNAPYVFAMGEEEVSELVNSINQGNNLADKQFIQFVDRDFNDWIINPVAVEILKCSEIEDENELIKCYDKIDELFAGSENVVYKRIGGPDEDINITEYSDLWDSIGDGKNPLDFYIVSHDTSDGNLRTHIYVNGDGWYIVSSINIDDIKEALTDYLFDGNYEILPKIASYIHNDGDLFHHSQSIV